uniref:helix-turn-helix domain-containing protein n=1 Tax=Nonomuraea sp. CA-251285 TaxID=3240002 RepID=UPI003F496762
MTMQGVNGAPLSKDAAKKRRRRALAATRNELDRLRRVRQVPGVTTSLLRELTGLSTSTLTTLYTKNPGAPAAPITPGTRQALKVLTVFGVAREVTYRQDCHRRAVKLMALPAPARDLILAIAALDETAIVPLTRKLSHSHITRKKAAVLDGISDDIIDATMQAYLATLRMRCLRAQGFDCARQASEYGRTTTWVDAVCHGDLGRVTAKDAAAVQRFATYVEGAGRRLNPDCWGGNLEDAIYAARQKWLPLLCYEEDGTYLGGTRHTLLSDWTGGDHKDYTRHALASNMIRILWLALEGWPAREVAEKVGASVRLVHRYLSRANLHFRVCVIASHGRRVEPVDPARAKLIKGALTAYRELPPSEQDPIGTLNSLGIPVSAHPADHAAAFAPTRTTQVEADAA